MDTVKSLVVVMIAAASFGAAAGSQEAEAPAADPPRWSVPADSPAQKYAVAKQEAGAALNEAIQECRAMHRSASAERRACEQEAREQWRREMQEARHRFLPDSVAAR